MKRKVTGVASVGLCKRWMLWVRVYRQEISASILTVHRARALPSLRWPHQQWQVSMTSRSWTRSVSAITPTSDIGTPMDAPVGAITIPESCSFRDFAGILVAQQGGFLSCSGNQFLRHKIVLMSGEVIPPTQVSAALLLSIPGGSLTLSSA